MGEGHTGLVCVVANVAGETAHGKGGLDIHQGLQHFAAGAKVWVLPPQWGDERMPWGAEAEATGTIERVLATSGAAVAAVEADLADTGSPALVFDESLRRLGNVTALVMCHCESVDSGLLDTTVESFDRHFAVNARASWLLIREFGRRLRALLTGGPGNSPAAAMPGAAMAQDGRPDIATVGCANGGTAAGPRP